MRFELKKQLSALLERLDRGKEIIIARRGRRVAKLTPAGTGVDRERSRAAMRRIRERAATLKLGNFEWNEWKRCRDEGRE